MAKLLAVIVGTIGALMIGGPGLASPKLTESAKRDDAVTVPRNDPAMEKAFERARSGLEQFLKRAKNLGSDEDGFSVKIPVRYGGHTEYFWITPFEEDRGQLKGRISNAPRLVNNVKKGQTVAFSRADIVDWMYLKGSTMYGNYTACALLAGRPAAEAAEFKRMYGLDCQP